MSAHIHPTFPGELASIEVPPDMALVETGLAGFSGASEGQLAFPFEALKMMEVPPLVVVDLPYQDMVRGPGKGYVLDLQNDFSEAYGLTEQRLYHVTYPQWGVPVTGSRLYLVASAEPVVIETTEAFQRTVQQVLPEVIYHAVNSQRRAILHPGFATSLGYANSATLEPFPPVADWKGKYPMCEKRDGDSLKVVRLSREDIQTLWGYLPLSYDPVELDRLSPRLVLQNFLSAVCL